VVQERPRQLEQAGKLQLGLVFHPERADDGHPLGTLGRVVQESRLAQSRLTTNHERAATPPSSATEQFVDARAVGLPTHEHVSTVALILDGNKD
jgi:hypothetical protein